MPRRLWIGDGRRSRPAPADGRQVQLRWDGDREGVARALAAVTGVDDVVVTDDLPAELTDLAAPDGQIGGNRVRFDQSTAPALAALSLGLLVPTYLWRRRGRS